MKCRHCGKDQRLTSAERGKRVSVGLKLSSKRIGRPQSFDRQEMLDLRKSGLSLRQIAKRLGVRHPAIKQALAKVSSK